MDAAQHLVRLGPIAVELIDRTMIELASQIAMFRPMLEQFVRGEPDAYCWWNSARMITRRTSAACAGLAK